MSNVKDRAAARLPLVPEAVSASYADALCKLQQVRLGKRRPTADRDLPAVGSFS
jgi:hypothetical protein